MNFDVDSKVAVSRAGGVTLSNLAWYVLYYTYVMCNGNFQKSGGSRVGLSDLSIPSTAHLRHGVSCARAERVQRVPIRSGT